MHGGECLPGFLPFCEQNLGVDIRYTDPKQEDMQILAPIVSHEFLSELGEKSFSRRSFEKWERIMHSHGADLEGLTTLRYGAFKRFADCVIYPESTEHCEKIVQLACKHNVCLVPYGGGTNVTKALRLSEDEKRMIVSIDMTRMTAVKWVDKENRLACI
jgi:alkyldihydroxyacetonephosphate synthase